MSYPWLILWISVFAIAMAFLESAVVVYLRTLYYPSGYHFPMPPINFIVGITEIGREFATMIMLLSVAIIAGKNSILRFGYFLFTFAVWDIFYYIFLRFLINWPSSLFDTDILFLIPVVWVSPVICPVITSVLMIILALFLIIGISKGKSRLLDIKVWILLILGSLIVLFSFTFDFVKLLVLNPDFKGYIIINEGTQKLISLPGFIPGGFNWTLFLVGILVIAISIVIVRNRYFRQQTK